MEVISEQELSHGMYVSDGLVIEQKVRTGLGN